MSENGQKSVPIIPLMFIMFAAIILIAKGSDSRYRYSPPALALPRPRIISIPVNDPAVVRFSNYAKQHRLKWEIKPDALSGTSYCADLNDTKNYRFWVDCRDGLNDAVSGSIANFEQSSVKIGNTEKD